MNKDLVEKIKLLRVKTGAGLIFCKQALIESNCNLDEAVVYLRKKGLSGALSKTARKTLSGVVYLFISEDRKTGIILEVNCETDFVSKSNDFLTYVKDLAKNLLFGNKFGKNFLLYHDDLIANVDVKNDLLKIIAKFGENIVINRVKHFSINEGFLFSYLHSASEFGKVGAILHANNESLDFVDLMSDISMQVVAMNPRYLSIDCIPESDYLHERNVCLGVIKNKNLNKSDSILEKMLNGQMIKFYKENVLLEQAFIKDPKLSVKSVVSNKFALLSFVRFEIG